MVTAASLTLALGGAAHAGSPLVTAPVIPGPDDALVCSIVNVGSMDQTVTVEVVDDGGTVLNAQTEVVAPNRVLEISGDDSARFCRFSGVSARRVRASACVFDIGITRCLNVIEAR